MKSLLPVVAACMPWMAAAQLPQAILTHQPLSVRTDAWVAGTWTAADSAHYTYDLIGRPAEQRTYKYKSGVWQPALRSAYRYNRAGQLTGVVIKRLNKKRWVAIQQQKMRYDAAGRLLERTEQQTENGKWVDAGRTTYGYSDTHDGTTNEYVSYVRDKTGQLAPKTRIVTTENAENDAKTVEEWRWAHDQWKPHARTQYTGAGDRRETCRYLWLGERWIAGRTQIESLTDGRLAEIQNFGATTVPADGPASRETLRYDDAGRCTEHRWLARQDTVWRTMQLETSEFDADNGNLLRERRLIYALQGEQGFQRTYFYPQPAGPAAAAATRQTPGLFPNPATDHVRIEWSGAPARQIVLYDAYGQRVTGIEVAAAAPYLLPLAGVRAGQYVVRLELTDGTFVAEKLVVQR